MTQTTLSRYEAPSTYLYHYWIYGIDCQPQGPSSAIRQRRDSNCASLRVPLQHRILHQSRRTSATRLRLSTCRANTPRWKTITTTTHRPCDARRGEPWVPRYGVAMGRWQRSGTASSFARSQRAPITELLATTGDPIGMFEYASDACWRPLPSSADRQGLTYITSP
jgi:hypothetical protein